MSDKIESIIKNPNVPIMTDEGISLLINYIYKKRGNYPGESGPSRRLMLSMGKIFTREKDLTFEESEKIHKKVFEQIVNVMREDLQKYPDFVEMLQAKNVAFNNFTKEDFVMVANLVQSGQIDDAISTDLGKYILEKNAMVVGCEYTGAFHMNLPYITKSQSSNINDDFRIYINTSNGKNAAEFLQEYAIRCAKQRIPYKMKGLYHQDETRTDGTILYVNIAHIEDVIKVLEEIKVERPELLQTFGSPLISAHNEGYYAITTDPKPQYTYNLFFDALSSLAFIKTISERILLRYGEHLPPDKKSELEILSKDETAFNFSAIGYHMNSFDVNRRIQDFFKTYRNQITGVIGMEKDGLIPLMKEKLAICTSLAYYGDNKHIWHSISFPKSIYEQYHINTLNDAKDENLASKPEFKFTQEKVIKQVCAKERILEIFNADERQIRVHAMLAGYSFAETEGKTEQELRSMLFDRITLDSETMIKVLCGGTYWLEQTMYSMGAEPSSFSEKTRDDLEKMFINMVGIDEVVRARFDVKQQEELTGEKMIHVYENSLDALRLERGKQILQSEQYNSCKTLEEQQAFLQSLSLAEFEDAHRYYSISENIKNSVDVIEKSC